MVAINHPKNINTTNHCLILGKLEHAQSHPCHPPNNIVMLLLAQLFGKPQVTAEKHSRGLTPRCAQALSHAPSAGSTPRHSKLDGRTKVKPTSEKPALRRVKNANIACHDEHLTSYVFQHRGCEGGSVHSHPLLNKFIDQFQQTGRFTHISSEGD